MNIIMTAKFALQHSHFCHYSNTLFFFSFAACNNSPTRHVSPPEQSSYPVASQVNISGDLCIKVKHILKLIERNSHKPFTSDEFPSKKAYGGPRYEMRFFASNFGRDSISLYIAVSQNYLHRRAKSKNAQVVIPALDITATIYHCSEGHSRCEITSVSLQTERKEIDSQNVSVEAAVVASFPKLVTHRELNLSKTESQSIMVCVNLKFSCA